MSNIFNANFISMWIRVGTPLIFAALGASICTQAGVVNLGLEGIMMISALMGRKPDKRSNYRNFKWNSCQRYFCLFSSGVKSE